MTTKSKRKSTTEVKTYNPDEVKTMAAEGYLTVRAAAELCHVRVDRVYRAIKARDIRYRIGANAYSRYVHRGDWLKLIANRRKAAQAALGIL